MHAIIVSPIDARQAARLPIEILATCLFAPIHVWPDDRTCFAKKSGLHRAIEAGRPVPAPGNRYRNAADAQDRRALRPRIAAGLPRIWCMRSLALSAIQTRGLRNLPVCRDFLNVDRRAACRCSLPSCGGPDSGTRNVNRVPCPSALATSTRPPIERTYSRTW